MFWTKNFKVFQLPKRIILLLLSIILSLYVFVSREMAKLPENISPVGRSKILSSNSSYNYNQWSLVNGQFILSKINPIKN